MIQLQAGYILEGVYKRLRDYCHEINRIENLEALLYHFSTFDVQTSLNLKLPPGSPSVIAVLNNIITRGLPTLPSMFIEEEISQLIGKTKVGENSDLGKYVCLVDDEVNPRSLYLALHPVENRNFERSKSLYLDDLDSNFERSFLLNLIPQDCSYLTQILEKQRKRNTLNPQISRGRVDFSMEIPYNYKHFKPNRYKQNQEISHKKVFVVEVDGKQYHRKLVDDLKDYQIKQIAPSISHIKEDFATNDVKEFLGEVLSEEYVKVIAANFKDPDFLLRDETNLILSGFGIARIQKVLLCYLASILKGSTVKGNLKIAVIERDIPCGDLALHDLTQSLNQLNLLSTDPINLPGLTWDIFASDEFLNHPLNAKSKCKSLSDFVKEEYDLVLDISLLRKSSIFLDDRDYESETTIIIRNSHFILSDTINPVVCSSPIIYRDLVKDEGNEVFSDITENTEILGKFLSDIFRKIKFRDGQLAILHRALQLKPVIGLLPTGGGKSLTYQLAALLQPGMTIVVDPLRSLMIDQYNGLRDLLIDKLFYINSLLSTSERNYIQENRLAPGRGQIIFVSPERFVIEEFRDVLKKTMQNGFFFIYAVIDEVHCVSEWGHDFRTPYLNLGENTQKFCKTYDGKRVTLMGLTATASFDVLADIERELKIEDNDGNALVRFENTVREELNYHIKKVVHENSFPPALRNPRIRDKVGFSKQKEIFNLIKNKKELFSKFNTHQFLERNVNYSYITYVSDHHKKRFRAKFGSDDLARVNYIREKLNATHHPSPFDVYPDRENNQYNYGMIVFTPHRTGIYGVYTKNSNSPGFYDNSELVKNKNNEVSKSEFGTDKLGLFVGSVSDNNDNMDAKSFECLDMFKQNKISTMVATKAFGMGIDKPDIRMTFHINIPQSIESFVQETGRAGRDGKSALSVLLYSDARDEKQKHDDREILIYFHETSFKGAEKEKTILTEIRTKIHLPESSNIEELSREIRFRFDQVFRGINLNIWGKEGFSRLYVNYQGNPGTIGFIKILSAGLEEVPDPRFQTDGNATDILNFITESIKNNVTDFSKTLSWLNSKSSMKFYDYGLEAAIAKLNAGETAELLLPFQNKFVSNVRDQQGNIVLNKDHLDLIQNTEIYKAIIKDGMSPAEFAYKLLKAVDEQMKYDEFVDHLKLNDQQLWTKMRDSAFPETREFINCYNAPRDETDTAKAVYRLSSVKIIDSYTIDYQNKLYSLKISAHNNDFYFDELENLIARYTSNKLAKIEVEKLKAEYSAKHKDDDLSVIGTVLSYLTDFIYDKIESKRRRAIDDMINLCETAVKMTDYEQQNMLIKDEIYYYFNAKYSRLDFTEPATGENASLPDDHSSDLGIYEIITKYIRIVEDERTGEFISNIKHLRGSSMRMLRSYPEDPCFGILKSYSLLMLADNLVMLRIEASVEMIRSLINWRKVEDDSSLIDKFIAILRDKFAKHITNYDYSEILDKIEDEYYTDYYSSWMKNFSHKFIEGYA